MADLPARRPPPDRRPARRTVTLFTRRGCRLCDQALAYLEALAPRLGFEIAIVDIEADDDLHRQYMYEIPVVAVGPRIVAQAPINAATLADDLREAFEGG